MEEETKCLACGQAYYKILADSSDRIGRAAMENVLGLKPRGSRRIVLMVCPTCGHISIFYNPLD